MPKALYPCEDNWDLLCEFYDRVTKIANEADCDECGIPDDLLALIDITERNIR